MSKGRWLFGLFVAVMIVMIGLLLSDNEEEASSHFRIGVLLTGDSRIAKLEGLKEGLADLGYERESLEFIVYNSYDELESLSDLAQQTILADPDIIVPMGAIETLTIKQEMERLGENIPVVFAGISAPIELGIIDDHRNPGGMFTGIDNNHLNLSAKRLELLTKLVPEIDRVIVLYDGSIDVSVMSLDIVKEAAAQLQVAVQAFDTHDENLFEQMEGAVRPNDGILVLPSYNIESLSKQITDFARNHHVPSMGIFEKDVENGFLAGYGSPFFDQGYQSARQVSLILQGNEPSVIPVELPDTIKFLINDKVRGQLGIELDPNTRLMADFLFRTDTGEKGGMGE